MIDPSVLLEGRRGLSRPEKDAAVERGGAMLPAAAGCAVIRAACAIAMGVVLLAGRPAAARTVAYAIEIGNNAPPAPSLPVLRYADDDAVRYHQLFVRIADQARLLAVLDDATQRRYPDLGARALPPTLAQLAAVVTDYAARMAADVRRGDQPVLYLTFSGHGAADADGVPYLALLDGPLTRQRLYADVIGKLPAATVHLIVDACNAGAVVGVRGPVELEAQTAEVTLSERLAVAQGEQRTWPTVGVVLAATADQETHEWSRIEAGVFSHEVLSGLLGAADANHDGRIEYSELAAFIAAANRDIPDPRAAPRVIVRPPERDHHVPLIALDALREAVYLTGDASTIGHFYLELPNGQRYLDAHLAPGAQLRIALPAGARLYLRAGVREAEIPARANGTVALAELRFLPIGTQGRGSVDGAYRDGLFHHAYGAAYYAGFVDSTGMASVELAAPTAGALSVAARARSPAADPPPPGRSLAFGVAIGAGVAGAVAITSGGFAYAAWRDYRGTELQRQASEAAVRYRRDLTISLVSGAAAVAGAAVSYWLWPRTFSTRVTPAIDSRSAALSVSTPF